MLHNLYGVKEEIEFPNPPSRLSDRPCIGLEEHFLAGKMGCPSIIQYLIPPYLIRVVVKIRMGEVRAERAKILCECHRTLA